MLIDTHTHLYLEDFDQDRKDIVERAINTGVKKLLLPNIDSGTIESLLKMAEDYPGICFPMMGLHPGSVKENYLDELELIKTHLLGGKYIAIGEIGIDLYWDKTYRAEQEKTFETQIEWAMEFNLPIVIHSRDSFNEIFEILDKTFRKGLRGVFHSFTGGRREVEKIKEYDFYYGINGISTFKNSDIKDVLSLIPEERLLLETDAPFLAPVPKRGRRNESSYLKYINDFIAGHLGIAVNEFEELTTKNAIELFNV